MNKVKTSTSNMEGNNRENEGNLEQNAFEIRAANIPPRVDEDNLEKMGKNSSASEASQPCIGQMLSTKTISRREGYVTLDIIAKVAGQLSLDDGGCSMRDLLYTLLSATTIGKKRRKTVFRTLELFLGDVEQSNLEDLKAVMIKLRKLFIPKQLIELTIEGSELDSFLVIAKGGFGLITKGILRRPNGSLEPVAIKTPLKKENERDIENEARALSQLNHENVVRLLAFQKNPLRIALEFMDMEDLTKVLKLQNISDKQLLNMLRDVACGMEYVADKKYVHRDLACRNILVNSKLECKIGDFGFCVYVGDSDGVYKEDEDGRLLGGPNIAPEVRATRQFSTKTDVWAMGILVWDAYFSASMQGIYGSLFDMQRMFVLEQFSLWGELPVPSRCPPHIINYVTNELLDFDSELRPTFTEIKEKITEQIL